MECWYHLCLLYIKWPGMRHRIWHHRWHFYIALLDNSILQLAVSISIHSIYIVTPCTLTTKAYLQLFLLSTAAPYLSTLLNSHFTLCMILCCISGWVCHKFIRSRAVFRDVQLGIPPFHRIKAQKDNSTEYEFCVPCRGASACDHQTTRK